MARISSSDNAAESWTRGWNGERRLDVEEKFIGYHLSPEKIKTVKTVPFLPTKKVGWPSFRTIDPSSKRKKKKKEREKGKRRFTREGVNVRVITTDVKTRHDTSRSIYLFDLLGGARFLRETWIYFFFFYIEDNHA